MTRHPHPTQRSTVHVADKVRPNDAGLWRKLGFERGLWLVRNSDGYFEQGCGGDTTWPAEESDLARLSGRFPGTLFVSDSTSSCGASWRMFALDGEAWRSIPTDGEWAPPILSGLL